MTWLIITARFVVFHYLSSISLGYWAVFRNPAVQLFSCKRVTIKLSCSASGSTDCVLVYLRSQTTVPYIHKLQATTGFSSILAAASYHLLGSLIIRVVKLSFSHNRSSILQNQILTEAPSVPLFHDRNSEYVTYFLLCPVLWCINYGCSLTLYVDKSYVLVSRKDRYSGMTTKISVTGLWFLNLNFGYYSNNRIIDICLTTLMIILASIMAVRGRCRINRWCCRLLQVSTLSEVTRHTASVATDDESLDGLVIVDDVVQTMQMPGIIQRPYTDAVTELMVGCWVFFECVNVWRTIETKCAIRCFAIQFHVSVRSDDTELCSLILLTLLWQNSNSDTANTVNICLTI